MDSLDDVIQKVSDPVTNEPIYYIQSTGFTKEDILKRNFIPLLLARIKKELEIDLKGYCMRHPADDYKNWQPTYAAYKNWSDIRKRQEQVIREMVSEAGELEGVVAKANRKGLPLDREKIMDELGDVLWGLVGIMNEFKISWYDLCEYNIKKLTKRNS